MRQREIELLMSYFLNYETILEQEVTQIRSNLRFRNIDQVDCLELALALERLQSFNNFQKNVRAILNLSALAQTDD